MTFDYKTWLSTGKERLDALKKQRAEIDAEIENLEAGLRAFAPLVEESGPLFTEGPIGASLTEAVRQMFLSFPTTSFAATSVRNHLREQHMILGQQNPMAVIHQILARLEDKKLIERTEHQGARYYRLRGGTALAGAKKLEAFVNPPLPRRNALSGPPPIRSEKDKK